MSRELEMAKLACRALDEKKGKDIKVIDIHEVSVIADYFVIASASNQNQVQAMVDNVDETLGRAGFEAKQIEGTRNSSWVLMYLTKKTVFSTTWKESGEMERNWISANFWRNKKQEIYPQNSVTVYLLFS